MINFFRKLATENKKLGFFLLALVAVGAMFLFLGRFAREPEEVLRESFFNDATPLEEIDSLRESFSYEDALERRLEDFLEMVNGAGKVRVMVSPLGSRETVFAIDANGSRSYTKESDGTGGSRETRTEQSNEQTVILTDRQGTDKPLVLREIEPRIEGIVIIAEGGDCPFVRDALTRAARAVLGLDAHMIQVLVMKN